MLYLYVLFEAEGKDKYFNNMYYAMEIFLKIYCNCIFICNECN